MNLERLLDRQRQRNPHKLFDMKIKLLQFLVTRMGLFVSWLASFLVAVLVTWLVKIEITLDSEMEGALILFVNQVVWGLIIWAVKTFEMPYKRELQELLGAVTIDGLIGPQVVKRAETVMNYAHSNTPLPPEKP